MTKAQLGQFFTTNSDYILQGLEGFVKNKEIIDPFAGNRDLMRWAKKHNIKEIKGYDCDKNYVDNIEVVNRDSINNPERYKFVLTNPPYLHKNKADKETKNKFFSGVHSPFEDLYQVSIFSILDSEEGILIVPLNFLCAENSKKIRNLFFEKLKIIKLNVFSQQVFKDTTYNVVSFYYRKKKDFNDKNKISAIIFPEKEKISFIIERKFDWQLGGNFINQVKNAKNYLEIFRLTEDFLKSGNYEAKMALQNIKEIKNFNIDENVKNVLERNILLLRAIDSKNGKKIQLEDIREYDILGLVGKNTSRNMAHIIFGQEVSIDEQEKLMREFNQELNRNRKKYFSFFLTNFRDNGRKRISFDFTYKFLNYLYEQKHSKQSTLL
ncbi:MAG: hypothetical protein A3I88_01465 [Candidatus Portnoybacteria bacterium RIFCSPLOWO2_12_FULL_39_9]|uniref:Uncharacterized protein n=1 Tax=Candidatus Portnoybacteria bacterium RIFCSPHIGHO2_12_FULL_38_9 TaxID=1801997 RepID=A0A1G2FFN5_9BACT|nr:MAG: hypothetical protein A3H00_01945 [Candidatus Portnoybacteria bacterium RBG_13_40_8]OGZ35270.1 MAG: hypothetical protein A2646_02005 [Candidatus Portnoybacteria bacterium RIFCSPHIGHO2_02_FULL_39_12]OGZ36884.1 MAG: hypothetical protein A3J64_03545 [Candidatus Portnoybacteria bacterium RIFCSPHIGHO2_12_FULL_38_9]OGZ38714.1 MAG: hypothetical protein A3F21_01295 [Candidatus Portnoybacteria bacterium RIFCSPLOWO2_01_FULL_38_39]OGZ40566.1 MAG: hypothetical protein A3I88_01465 [Candidatus Portnoy